MPARFCPNPTGRLPHQLVSWNGYAQVAQVVYPCIFYDDELPRVELVDIGLNGSGNGIGHVGSSRKAIRIEQPAGREGCKVTTLISEVHRMLKNLAR